MKGPNGEKRKGDTVQKAITVAKIATGEIKDESPTLRHKGGKARAKKLSGSNRKSIATKAAKIRWKNQD